MGTPDVFCLEEVDRIDEYSEIIKTLGSYEVEYQPKIGHESGRTDGVAVFWNTQTLDLKHCHKDVYRGLKKPKLGFNGYVICVFEHLETSKII
jgi:mRNA deadenylase 3'-5' endonuclease subunit Ccr4